MSPGLTSFAEQAKEKSAQIVIAVDQRIRNHQKTLERFEPDSRPAKRLAALIESVREDLRRLQDLIEEINIPFEESGMKKTPYMVRQRELGKRILKYNSNYNSYSSY